MNTNKTLPVKSFFGWKSEPPGMLRFVIYWHDNHWKKLLRLKVKLKLLVHFNCRAGTSWHNSLQQGCPIHWSRKGCGSTTSVFPNFFCATAHILHVKKSHDTHIPGFTLLCSLSHTAELTPIPAHTHTQALTALSATWPSLYGNGIDELRQMIYRKWIIIVRPIK